MGKSYNPRALAAFRSGPIVGLDGRHKERFQERRNCHYEMGILYILANRLRPSPKLSFQHLIGYDGRLLVQGLAHGIPHRSSVSTS